MRILVLGATGMAGHTISIYLKERGYDVTAFTRSKFKYCNNIVGDITDFSYLNKIITEGNYDVVINAIGILNKDAEEDKSRAILINSYLPHFLTDITKKFKTRIFQMSTDCVFSGRSGNYTELSLKDGETFYDRSKSLGEIIDTKNLTFRNSIIGPDMKVEGMGLFNWFMNQTGEISGYDKAIWTGVTTLTLAKAMEVAINENLVGLYNLVNNQTISKYELLKLFNMKFKENKLIIRQNTEFKVDKSLVNTRNDFSFVVPDYSEMIIEMKNWIISHRELYPHYFS